MHPVAASRISLRSMAELDDPSSEFNAEIELISFACSSKRIAITSLRVRVKTDTKRTSNIGTFSLGVQTNGKKRGGAPWAPPPEE
jgi:hypothetical protein